MSTAAKIASMVETIESEISKNVKSHHFRTFCKTICPHFHNLKTFAILEEERDLYRSHQAFVDFCVASIWWEIVAHIKIAMLADDEIEEREIKLAYDILQPAAECIARVDKSWEQFSPLLSSEIGEMLDFTTSKGPRLIRCYEDADGESSIMCGPIVPVLMTATLAMKNLEIACLYKKVFTITFKAMIQADGHVNEEELKLYDSARQIADQREGHCKIALAHLLSEFDENMQATSGGSAGLANNSTKTGITSEKTNPEKILTEASKELSDLIGLKPVKQEISRLANFLKIESKRKASGLSGGKQSLHFVFTGNPGTGKTTVGRIMSKLLYGNGVLKTANLVETDRGGLVGGFIGQTAIKTKEVLESALDGVLFIDEAYALVGKNENDFGFEAIETILKGMEDNRDRIVIIAAGYTKNMEEFLNSNPGLKSRFTRFIEFPDYTPKDLCKIYLVMADQNQYTLTQEAIANLAIICHALYTSRDRNFGNGRLVRNLFEKTLGNHADRIVELEDLSREVLTTITDEDLPYEMAKIKSKLELSSERWSAKCESCGTVHNATIKLIGKSAKCKCGATFKVPCWSISSDGKPFEKYISPDLDGDDFLVWD